MAILDNIGSGSSAVLSGTYTLFPLAQVTRFGADGQADTGFVLPTASDWLLIEVHTVEGVEGDIGITRWTDDISNIQAMLDAVQAEADAVYGTYTIEAMHYKFATGLCDTWIGNASTAILFESPDISFTHPIGNWLITDTKTTPTYVYPFQIEFDTFSYALTNYDVQLYIQGGGTVITKNLDTGDTIYSSSTIAKVPMVATSYRYRMYSSGVITKFSFSGSSSNAWITNLDVMGIDNVTEFHDGTDGAFEEFQGTNITFHDNTSAVTNFLRAFYGTDAMTSMVGLSPTTNVTNFQHAWYQSKLNWGVQAHRDWLDTSSGTNFISAFSYPNVNSSMPDLDLRSATTMEQMFSGRTSAPVNVNTTGVTNFTKFFNNYYGAVLPIFDETSGTTFNYCFWNCNHPSLVIHSPFVVKGSGYYMFNGCYALPAIIDTSLLGNFQYMFYLSKFTGQCSDLDASNSTSFLHAFDGLWTAFLLPTILDTSKGTNFDYAFNSFASAIPALDLRLATTTYYCFNLDSTASWRGEVNMLGVTDFDHCFAGCSIPLPLNLDTSTGVNFSYAFHQMVRDDNFQQLDFSNGDQFDYTFGQNSQQLYYPHMQFPLGTNFNRTFYNCTSLICMDSCNTLSQTYTVGMFDFVGANCIAPDATERATIMAGANWVNGSPCPPI